MYGETEILSFVRDDAQYGVAGMGIEITGNFAFSMCDYAADVLRAYRARV